MYSSLLCVCFSKFCRAAIWSQCFTFIQCPPCLSQRLNYFKRWLKDPGIIWASSVHLPEISLLLIHMCDLQTLFWRYTGCYALSLPLLLQISTLIGISNLLFYLHGFHGNWRESYRNCTQELVLLEVCFPVYLGYRKFQSWLLYPELLVEPTTSELPNVCFKNGFMTTLNAQALCNLFKTSKTCFKVNVSRKQDLKTKCYGWNQCLKNMWEFWGTLLMLD